MRMERKKKKVFTAFLLIVSLCAIPLNVYFYTMKDKEKERV